VNRTLRHRLLVAAIWGLTAAWLVVTFWLVRPYDNISASPFVSNAERYAPGDTAILTNEFCWDGTPFESLRVLAGPIAESTLGTVRFPNGYVLPEIAAQYEATGCAPSTVRVQIPVTQPPGTYRIRYETSYQPAWNPVRTVRFTVESNMFTVSPN